MSGATTSTGTLDGETLLALFATASALLDQSAAAIDAINVYPVPDGDTGSNMAATLRQALDSARAVAPPRDAGNVLRELARGALYGARGNSGVIFSQALRGMAEAAAGAAVIDGPTLSRMLTASAARAYEAVSKPVEGTMLTVLRVAAEAAARCPASTTAGPALPVLETAVRAAEAAEAATPTQLPALAEAGVTDSGGEGVCVILRGLLAGLTGERLEAPVEPGRPLAELAGHAGETFGYCTEFVIEPLATPIDVAALRATAEAGSNRSVVVVGDETLARVHVHSDDAEALLAAARAFGRVSRVKVDDMSAQHGRFKAAGSGASAPLAVLALSRGEGFDAIFEGLGAHVVDLGGVVKPAAGDIAAGADALATPDVIVLPNHKNVILAARQAARLTRCTLTVVETESLPQGVAAAVAFDPQAPTARAAAAMRDAARQVTAIEVTVAAADRTAGGVTVKRGEAIALVAGHLVASAASGVDALLAGLRAAGAGEGGLVTVYTGEDARGREETARVAVAAAFPGTEVQFLDGGQPLYEFVASVER